MKGGMFVAIQKKSTPSNELPQGRRVVHQTLHI